MSIVSVEFSCAFGTASTEGCFMLMNIKFSFCVIINTHGKNYSNRRSVQFST